MAQKFEFKLVPQDLYSAEDFEARLNQLGLEGWQLVTAKQQGNAMSAIMTRMVTGEENG